MALESGVYIISCRGIESYIGRNTVADNTLLARLIISLPKCVEAPRFIIEKSLQYKGCYVIRTTEGLVAEKDNLLWAFLIHHTPTPACMWLLNPQIRHGPSTYTIEKPNQSACWVLPDKRPETQVVVKPLPVLGSLPSQFLPGALFDFTRIDRD